MPTTDAQSTALGKLLLIQNALEVLPNETSIASFLCRSLSTIPGVKDVHVCIRGVLTPDDATYRELCRACGENGSSLATPPPIKLFPLRTSHQVYGALFLFFDNEDQFSFCQPYLANTANTVATLLDSRDHVHQLHVANEQIQRGRDELEVRVQQRTADLLRANEELKREMCERKANEAKVHRITNLYAALSQCNEAIVRSTSEEELFPKICRSAVQFGGMKMVWIGFMDEASQQVKPAASYGAGVEYLEGIRLSTKVDDPNGRGPTGTSIRESRPFWCQDFQHDLATTSWHEHGVRFGWGASASLPLYRNGVAIGAFTIYAGEVNAFDEAARNLLVEMARDISFALDNFDRDRKCRQAQQALISSESHFRAYFERSMVGMAASSPQKGFLEINEALCAMLGYSRAELMRLTWAELTYPGDIADNEILFSRVLSGEIDEYTMDKRFIRKDGSFVYVHLATRAVRHADGSLDYMVALIEDITERKKAEERIQHLAHFDQLTGLPNRVLFTDRIKHALSMAQRSHEHLAVLFLDLDHFKNVNDTLGHSIGDALLVEVAKCLKAAIREGDTVSR